MKGLWSFAREHLPFAWIFGFFLGILLFLPEYLGGTLLLVALLFFALGCGSLWNLGRAQAYFLEHTALVARELRVDPYDIQVVRIGDTTRATLTNRHTEIVLTSSAKKEELDIGLFIDRGKRIGSIHLFSSRGSCHVPEAGLAALLPKFLRPVRYGSTQVLPRFSFPLFLHTSFDGRMHRTLDQVVLLIESRVKSRDV